MTMNEKTTARPSKRHDGKTVKMWSPTWLETAEGVYRHVERSGAFELDMPNGKRGRFERSEWEVLEVR